MKINKLTNQADMLITEVKNPSHFVEINDLMGLISKNVNKPLQKLETAYKLLKTYIYCDYVDDETGEETTDFHGNIKTLYTEEEQEVIKNYVEGLENYITNYTALKTHVPDLFNIKTRLDDYYNESEL